jgi:hypothetical protein
MLVLVKMRIQIGCLDCCLRYQYSANDCLCLCQLLIGWEDCDAYNLGRPSAFTLLQ